VIALAAASWPALASQQATALKALVDGAKASQSDTLLVIHDGKVLANYRRPGTSTDPIDMMSSTKSLVGLAVGRLITQGKLRSLDQPVSDFYPEWKQGNKAKITVRMLLNHTSGLQNVGNTTVEIYPAPDGFQLALAAELSDPPGTKFSYNNKAMNLIAGVIEKAAGEPMDVYIAKELLAPMGIDAAPWGERDKAGHPFAMSGWMATPEEAGKIGELVMAQGRWHDKQLIDAAYMQQMVSQSTPLYPYYGLLWWLRSGDVRLSAGGLDKARAAGVDTAIIDKLAKAVGKPYASTDDFAIHGLPALGIDLQTFREQLKTHHIASATLFQPSPIVAWEANGYLGNYVVIVPKAHLVAIRQITSRDDVNPEQPWPNGYEDFTHRVVELARSYTNDLAVDTPDKHP
jgi:CubicO group peptidase (beta-lactamase class C family)